MTLVAVRIIVPSLCLFLVAACAENGDRLTRVISTQSLAQATEGKTPFQSDLLGDRVEGATESGSGDAGEKQGDLPNVKASVDQAATYFGTRNASSKVPADHDKAVLYYRAGIALSDKICQTHFLKLGLVQQRINADRDLTSNVGALSTVVLGLADVRSAVVGAVGGVFGFAENAYQSELENFALSVDISAVEELVALQRDVDQSSLEIRIKQGNRLTFHDVERILDKYHGLCSTNSIRRTVRNAIETTSLTRAEKLDAQLAVLKRAVDPLKATFDRLSLDGLAALFAYLGTPANQENSTIRAILRWEGFDVASLTEPDKDRLRIELNQKNSASQQKIKERAKALATKEP